MSSVLLLVHRMPYPPSKGDKIRSYHLLRHLQRRHRVFLGTFVDSESDVQWVADLRRQCPDLFLARLDRRRALWRGLRSLARSEPLTLGYYADASVQAWVAQVVREHAPQACVVFCSSMAQYAPAGLPTFVDFVDLDSAKWRQYGEVHRMPMAWVYRREARELAAYESAVAKRARGVFFVTEAERELFALNDAEGGAAAQVMRNGVDADHFVPDPSHANPFAADELPLVFTGSMDYLPNVDAVLWFAAEILPALRAEWPAIRLHVVGREPTREIRALAGEAVSVTGTVPDTRPYLQHAALVVAPMRRGRGIQNKILEAMAMARVVVTTPDCAQAVGAGVDEGVVAAASSDAFIAAVLAEVRREPVVRAARGSAARAYVIEHCRWDTSFEALDRSMQSLEGAALC